MNINLDKMLFTIKAAEHTTEEIKAILQQHQEVKFVSVVGVDIGGLDTDEKIPIGIFLEDIDKFLKNGVQTDGSSVVLPRIANLNNARVDIIPDKNSNWYVDYNYDYIDSATGLPVGSLRIPAYLKHSSKQDVGSRVILRDAIANFEKQLRDLIQNNPYILEYLPFDSYDDIEEFLPTCATELEFWVKTPEEKADHDRLSVAQTLKEQYWKRTIGPVRSALEETLIVLDRYGFEIEMGHKEVGGVKAKMNAEGNFEHVMEQLEIDWKYASPIQTADNERFIKNVVKDIFRMHGLDVTFHAKPIEGVAGSGEHTHLGYSVRLKNGKIVNLFAPLDMTENYLNPIGFGALMGILKNYEVLNPFISTSSDAFNRLKPGYEAPICIVTSLGISPEEPSRNRTVLAGLVRDLDNPLSTRFELRSPNPKSNTYILVAAAYIAMMDGIRAALENGKTPKELEKSISKKSGEEDFYLETEREYRTELNVYEDFTDEERDKLFGIAPRTVWENICAFDKYPEKFRIMKEDAIFADGTIDSFKDAIIEQWSAELVSRAVPNALKLVQACKPIHASSTCTNLDIENWDEIAAMRRHIAQDTKNEKCLLTRITEAIEAGNYDLASDLQVETQALETKLSDAYANYVKNIL